MPNPSDEILAALARIETALQQIQVALADIGATALNSEIAASKE